MNLRMALFTKSYQTTQMFQFMSDNRHTAYLVGFMMNLQIIAYIIHSGFISGYQNRYGDNLKPPTNVYHRMTA